MLTDSNFQMYLIILTGIIGLIIGSFLNVVALRLLSEESIVFPASKCTKCGEKIRWYDNIPVVSYILLGGKCRSCKERISIQYPIVEITTAFFFVATYLNFGLSLKTLFLWVLISALVVITVTDLREKLVYDITTFPLILLGLIYNFFNIGQMQSSISEIPVFTTGMTIPLQEVFISAVIGAIVGAVFFEAFSFVGQLLVGQRAFGEGDTIIAAGFGAWFGWEMVLVIIALSFIFQLIIGIPVILYNMYKDKDYKSIIAFSVLILSVFIPQLGNVTGLTNTLAGALLVTLVSFAVAGVAIFIVFKQLRERESFTFMPFGPALVFGGIVVIFYGQEVLARFV